ncbi:manganese/iron transport system permease protein/iron/zinc/copper transport system permease protein [Prosthecobacter fusiformis]|uniref:Manganese/iron transport system permease protein/iron/zinc/copper transport system permease protein n=1 Tax=Prosthecobacter fusiformis TaxID=48464 RepID=A0A4R7S270_9BACT|nr:metal ABC transporter permease [Prosthecobacter fusiformis]TDU71097.1 manganese/iron transport system permease protein/iron/zinc/copper transport system permease protein [Prosthecobacter fusiformis]
MPADLPSLSEFLAEPIARRALLACLMIGFANGFVSAFVVLRKSALKVGTLSHALLPGIALAVLMVGLTQWSALAGALFAALLVGLGSIFLSRTSRLDQDTSMGILYTTAFAGGYLILTQLNVRQKLDEWLFGSIVGMADSDMWIAFGISAIAVLSLTALQRPLLIYLFEPNIAASLGVPVRFLNYATFGITILVLISSLQAVGCILSVGLMVAPAATVYLLTNNARTLFWGGGLIGAFGSVLAFFLSYPLGWSVSASIIVVLGGLFLLAYIFSPRYGLFSKRGRV